MSLSQRARQICEQIAAEQQRREAAALALPETDINFWLARVRHCNTPAEVFSTLDAFRPGAWTDEQRAELSRAYMRVLNWLAQGGD